MNKLLIGKHTEFESIDLLYLSPFIVYFLVGAFVALHHMKRNDMVDAAIRAEESRQGFGLMVVCLLTCIWPVLLLAMLLAPKSNSSGKGDLQNKSPDSEDSATEN